MEEGKESEDQWNIAALFKSTSQNSFNMRQLLLDNPDENPLETSGEILRRQTIEPPAIEREIDSLGVIEDGQDRISIQIPQYKHRSCLYRLFFTDEDLKLVSTLNDFMNSTSLAIVLCFFLFDQSLFILYLARPYHSSDVFNENILARISIYLEQPLAICLIGFLVILTPLKQNERNLFGFIRQSRKIIVFLSAGILIAQLVCSTISLVDRVAIWQQNGFDYGFASFIYLLLCYSIYVKVVYLLYVLIIEVSFADEI